MPLSAAAVPTLSRVQDEPDEFRRYYLKGISYLTFIAMPITAFAFVAREEIIRILLGEGWGGAVSIPREGLGLDLRRRSDIGIVCSRTAGGSEGRSCPMP